LSLADQLWITFCALLVFLMQVGFLCLEAGATRRKNNINVALKNITDFAIAVLLFWLVGDTLMFGTTWHGIGVNLSDGSALRLPQPTAIFIFQMMFCSTAVTIVSGAVAERMRFQVYMLTSVLISGLIYPVFGHWAWNGYGLEVASGWLEALGFVDFAGATVVHSVGGWVSLAALLLIGPRYGRFKHNTPRSFSGSDMPLAIVGILILWLGWLGFNSGSLSTFNDTTPKIVLNTILAGASGLLLPILMAWKREGQIPVEWITNGCLAGLVSVTASCHVITPAQAIVIGAISGLVMCAVERLLVRYQIDDAVGAIPVHLGGGIWGTLAVALFVPPERLGTGLSSIAQVGVQCLGIVACGIWSFGVAYLALRGLNHWRSLRVSWQQEMVGLNLTEHGATSDLGEMLNIMEQQLQSGDLSLRIPIDPFSDVGQIAVQYNRVIGKLEAAVARTEAIVQTAIDGIITFQPSDGIITTVNPAVVKMFCCPATDLIGQPIASLFALDELEINTDDSPSDPQLKNQAKNQAAQSFLRRWNENQEFIESFGRRKTGKTFPIELRFTLSPHPEGVIAILALRDITRRKLDELSLKQTAKDLRSRNQNLNQALANLRQAQSQLVQSEKISALGHMVGGIAHEINNPVSFIYGNLAHIRNYIQDLMTLIQLYAEKLPEGDQEIEQFLEEIDFEFLQADLPSLLKSMQTGAERIQKIVESLKTFSHLDESELKAANLNECLESTLLLLEYNFRKYDIQVQRHYQDLPKLDCYVSDLNQVFFNLLQNAIDALVPLVGSDRRLQICITTSLLDDNIQITIADTGVGISAATLSRIFDPFYTTKEIGKGTGLGLAVSYQIIVEGHQGKLEVSSERGSGSTFNLLLPLHPNRSGVAKR